MIEDPGRENLEIGQTVLGNRDHDAEIQGLVLVLPHGPRNRRRFPHPVRLGVLVSLAVNTSAGRRGKHGAGLQ
jgi:hypothetical protein